MTARHAHPNVRTEGDYRARQREAIDVGRLMYPNLPWRDPWLSTDRPPVFVTGGRWAVECSCGNVPLVAPEWGGLACCYECGAIYEGLEMPADQAEIEALLIRRRPAQLRYWNPTLTLEGLRAQNQKLGVR